MKLLLLNLFLSFSLIFALGFATKLRIEGPISDLFVGDYELFTCFGAKSSFSGNFTWKYKFLDGHFEDVTSADIAEDKVVIMELEDNKMRKSYIRIKSAEISKMYCYATEHNSNEISDVSSSLDLHHFKQIYSLEEPSCEENPKIILKRWDESFQSQYWVSHYVTNEGIQIYSHKVTGIKLTCLSNHRVKWFTTKDLKGFQYWTSNEPAEKDGCYSATLVLNPLSSLSSQKYICGEDKKGNYVDVKILGPIRSHEFDFNKTQECIEHLGTTVFGSQTLTWATTGTSLLSVGMMVGIVFLKKQLDRQKEINNQPGPSAVASQS